MSHDAAEVERLRAAFDAALRGEPEQWVRLLDPDIGWDLSAHPLPDVPTRGTGRDALLAGWATYLSGWNSYRAEIENLVAGGDQVVITVHETARMRHTDVLLDRDLTYLWTLGGTGVSFVRVFKTVDEGLDAAGLTE